MPLDRNDRRLNPIRKAVWVMAWLAVAGTAFADSPPSISAAEDASAQQMLADIRTQVFQSFPRDKAGPSRSGGQLEAFVGREEFYMERQTASRPLCIPLKGDPLKVIARRARQSSIVVINEDHSSPLDRHFIGEVLKILRRQGFTIYAAEAFTRFDNIDHPDVMGFDGWYSNEPTFGDAIRTAKSLGYTLVAYEETQAQRAAGPQGVDSNQATNRREQSQSDNLMSAIFTSNPNAKAVIHVGHGHVRERPQIENPDFMAMAQRLKTATGKDPLTISQTSCRSPGVSDVIGESVVNRNGAVGESTVDLYIGHPIPMFKDGRPVWRRQIGQKEVDIPPEFLNRTERVIVEARPVGDGLSTVPLDRVLLFPGEHLKLLLSPGSYRLDGFIESGRLEQSPSALTVK